MLFPFLDCLHNRRKEGIIYELHPYHSCVLYERMKPDSWIILGDFSDLLWTIFFFFEVAHFFTIKDKKNEDNGDEGWSHDFHFPSKFKQWGG